MNAIMAVVALGFLLVTSILLVETGFAQETEALVPELENAEDGSEQSVELFAALGVLLFETVDCRNFS
ncbi:hypothetical protein [Leisingera caerulea]|uniref:hypothetical protein n=1 Tax=Leisingera caerulea TaxID=506591 RepID=UPI0021A44FDC|nr:hypothetical protein [Leisingera caerulea]UWQ84654.1 hypothetical protein K3726_05475 [Leisingera caerulea]